MKDTLILIWEYDDWFLGMKINSNLGLQLSIYWNI